MIQRYVRDPLYGNITFSVLEYKLINTNEFRKLKRIKQLSLAQYEYPSANHTRFEHCIGTYHVTEIVIDLLNARSNKDDKELLNKYKNHVKVAALLHDIGHTAFSHSIEQILQEHPEWSKDKMDHEIASYQIIMGDTSVKRILQSKFNDVDIELIANIATGDVNKKLTKDQYFLTDIITGDIGSDRIDYLKRDSYHTGLSYGNIEIEQLISNLCIDTIGGTKRICIKFDEGRKGLSASSFLLIGRQYHFDSIAHQQRIRCANAMLKKAFELYMDDISNTDTVVSDCFKKYDDNDLLNQLVSNETSTNYNEIKRLVNLIKNEHTLKEDEPSFRRIDDFPPQVNFMLQIINQNQKPKLKLRRIIESKIRSNNNDIKGTDFLVFDMYLNGKKGIPSSLYLDAKDSRSCLLFDKAPLTEELSACLPQMGSLAVFSEKKIQVNFFDFVQDIKKIVSEIRSGKLIPAEVALIALIQNIASYHNYGTKIREKLNDRNINHSFPAIGRLMGYSKEFFKKHKIEPYDDFQWIRPTFLFSPKLYEDLILLSSCFLIDINKKPIAIDETDKPVDLDINNLESVQTMISKYIFSLTTRGIDYVLNDIIPSKKCTSYNKILNGL